VAAQRRRLPAQAYHWALGALWLLQLAGLAWFMARAGACLRLVSYVK